MENGAYAFYWNEGMKEKKKKAPLKSCPGEETWWRFLKEQRTPAEEAALLDHLIHCPLCFSALTGFLEMGKIPGEEAYGNWKQAATARLQQIARDKGFK